VAGTVVAAAVFIDDAAVWSAGSGSAALPGTALRLIVDAAYESAHHSCRWSAHAGHPSRRRMEHARSWVRRRI